MNFEKIYKEYRDRVFRFTYTYTKNTFEQEELVQDIFYNTYIGLKNFQKRSSLSTFIYSIARNTCNTYIRKNVAERKKIDKMIRLYEPDFIKSPCENIILSEDVEYFLSIVGRLSEEYREIFYLYEVEDLKYKEISKILKIPIGTVKSRLNRAKEKILEFLHEEAKNEQ